MSTIDIFPTGIAIGGVGGAGGGGLLGGRRGRYRRADSYSGTDTEFNEMDRIIRVSTQRKLKITTLRCTIILPFR